MDNADLEMKIEGWKKQLRKSQYLEDGTIEEFEDHLRNSIDQLLEEGHTLDSAFDKTVKRIGDAKSLGKEMRLSKRATDTKDLFGLLHNSWKVGARILRKDKLTSLINITGLALAFSSTSFIGIFLYDEFTYEHQHPGWEKMYRLSYEFTNEEGTSEKRAFSSGLWAPVLSERFSGIQEYFRFLNLSFGYMLDPNTQQSFYEEEIYWSDPNFFDFLHFPLKYGEKIHQLKNLNSIVLTETTSKKIFGEINPIGNQLKYVRRGNEVNFTVTGVIFDPPGNSHFQPDYIAHLQALQNIFGEENHGWIDNSANPGWAYSYLKADPSQLDGLSESMQSYWNEAIPDRATRMKPLITPISSIHFNPPIKWEKDTPINVTYLYGLALVGLFILFISSTNFANAIIAKMGKRSKEFGLRKTLGSSNAQLRIQLFLEACQVLSVSLIVSAIICILLMPIFNNVLGKHISLWRMVENPLFLRLLILKFFSIYLLLGTLPGFIFQSRLSENYKLNSLLKQKRLNPFTRNMVVTLQFAAAIFLIVSTIVVRNQLKLINSDALAQNRNEVIGIRTSQMGDSLQIARYKHRIQELQNVEAITLGMHLPKQPDFGRIDTRFYVPGVIEEPVFANKFETDGGFQKTYELNLIEGRDFISSYEPNRVLVNEAFVRQLGLLPEEIIGVYLKEDSINGVFNSDNGYVIGVVEDFAYENIKSRIDPLVITASHYLGGVLSVRLSGSKSTETVDRLNEIWLETYPERPFEYWFLDKEYQKMYHQERRLGKLIPVSSGLAIVIALLGLFALTNSIANQREKEIGVRKVLGGTPQDILILLSRELLLSLAIAAVIALPVAYMSMSIWLSEFTYRVTVDASTMGLSFIIVASVAILTMSLKFYQAANQNPVKSLRSE